MTKQQILSSITEIGIVPVVRTSTAEDGTVLGHYQATGVRPRFLADLLAKGIKIPGNYFDPSHPL